MVRVTLVLGRHLSHRKGGGGAAALGTPPVDHFWPSDGQFCNRIRMARNQHLLWHDSRCPYLSLWSTAALVVLKQSLREPWRHCHCKLALRVVSDEMLIVLIIIRKTFAYNATTPQHHMPIIEYSWRRSALTRWWWWWCCGRKNWDVNESENLMKS